MQINKENLAMGGQITIQDCHKNTKVRKIDLEVSFSFFNYFYEKFYENGGKTSHYQKVKPEH